LDDAMSLITDGQNFCYDGREVQGKRDYAETEFYNKLILAINKQAASGEGVTIRQAMEEMRHDWSKGAPRVNPGHEIRWGTIYAVASSLRVGRRMILAGVTRKFAHAFSDDDEIAAIASAFSHKGWISTDHLRVQVEPQLQNTFALLTRPCDRVQFAILDVLNTLFLKPLFSAASANQECGAQTMFGLNSCVRKLLLIWSRAIFVDTTLGGKGWGKAVTYAHRTDGSRFSRASESLRALNPMCGSKVDLLLGDFRNQGALTAISELVGTFKEVASLDGDVLPEDLRAAYDKVHATSKCKKFAKTQPGT
jgi:hypothetical protein